MMSSIMIAMVALFGTLAYSAEMFDESNVLVLTEDNFTSALKSNQKDGYVVEFYSPWCDLCKALALEYAKAARILQEENIPFGLAKVNGENETDLAATYKIKGFPTLKFFADGEFQEEFISGRTAEDIVGALRKRLEPIKETTSGVHEVAENVVVGFFDDPNTALATTYASLKRKYTKLNYSILPTTAAPDGVPSGEQVIMYKKGGEIVIYPGTGDLLKFLKDETKPLVNHLDEWEKAGETLPENATVLHFIGGKVSKDMVQELTAVAKTWKGKITFIYGDYKTYKTTESDDFYSVLEDLAIKKNDLDNGPVYGLVDANGLKYKPVAKQANELAISLFIEAFLEKKLTPYLRCGNLPKDWNKKPVKVVTSKSLVEFVKSGKNVFLLKGAEWSDKENAIVKELAAVVTKEMNVDIAWLDGEVNDVYIGGDSYVEEAPAYVYYPKDGEPVSYEGSRKLENILTFLKSHGKEVVPKGDDEVEEAEEQEEDEEEQEEEEEEEYEEEEEEYEDF